MSDVCGESTDKPTKNNVGTKRNENARFGAKMAAFWEKCKIRCKIRCKISPASMLMCGKEAKPRQRQPRLPLYRIRMEQ